jgi:hypothetical protein
MDENKKILNYAKKHPDGFTAQLKNGRIIPVLGSKKERYSVADKTAIVYIQKEKNIRNYAPITNNSYFGGWFDRESGRYLIENTNLYSNRNHALKVARKRKQKAIFDLVQKKEIGLHYKHREHITGMRIKTVPKKDMKEYVGLHGKLPKNELPKRFRHIPKKDVLIRAGLTKKRRKDILSHEKEEITLMDKGMKYKPAHRKTIKILWERKHRPVVYKYKSKYMNRLTGKYVSKSTAQRLNLFFENHPGATLYEAQKGVVYDPQKPWEEQNERLFKVYKRENQLIKTKDRFGNDVYFSPLLNKRISKEKVKKLQTFDYEDSGFFIHLYRITSTKRRVYHLLKYPLKYTLEEHEDINQLEHKLLGSWKDSATRVIKDVATRHPLGNRDAMKMDFSHLNYHTGYEVKDNGEVTVFTGTDPKRNNVGAMMPDEIHKAMLKYHSLLTNYYRIFIKEIIIYIFNNANEKNMMLAETRIGLLKGK